MIYSIDYYSFTIPYEFPSNITIKDKNNLAIAKILDTCKLRFIGYFSSGDWLVETGARQYQVRLRHKTVDICISFGSINAHIFVECAGKACNNLDALDALVPIIKATADRTSRIDFAVDILTDCDPREFVAQREGTAFKSSGEIRSPAGRTNYIGSRTSDRMARVYRYEPPHPRASYLRVEAEYKHAAAKAASRHFTNKDVSIACLDAHTPFQWKHPAWTPENLTSSKIPYKAYRPDNASTIRWLYGDVVTALSKAVKEGLVDFEEWVNFVREGLF